jgi:molybdopterin-biosynthesis enzyme MoeA-like protein
MGLTNDDIAALVAATAKAIDLPLKADHLPGVKQYVRLAASMAEQVNGFPLVPHDEPATVFTPRDLDEV